MTADALLRLLTPLLLAAVLIAPAAAAQGNSSNETGGSGAAEEDPFAGDTNPFTEDEDPLADYEAGLGSPSNADEPQSSGQGDEEGSSMFVPGPGILGGLLATLGAALLLARRDTG